MMESHNGGCAPHSAADSNISIILTRYQQSCVYYIVRTERIKNKGFFGVDEAKSQKQSFSSLGKCETQSVYYYWRIYIEAERVRML